MAKRRINSSESLPNAILFNARGANVQAIQDEIVKIIEIGARKKMRRNAE
jgi:hypothetical protein